ncbi:MAG: hypothetical protein EHM20_16910 [Alphaproteobacteria bacterium]|nr:MAG: hypothetical protein EHM20_16910 [Alphaproteobacteria bacterium]
MDISISDAPTLLLLGGLFFVFISLVKINKDNNCITIEAVRGREKYLLLIGIIACTTAIYLYTDVSGPTDTKGELTPTKAETPEFTCNAVGTNYECNSWSNEQYPVIKLFEEKYVPLFSNHEKIWNAHIDKVAKLVLDLHSEGKSITLRSDEALDFSEGYTLEIKQIDVDDQTVWLELTSDGESIDDKVISVTDDGTWNVEADDVQGVDDVLVFRVHVSKIAQSGTDSTVEFDGLWLIDYVNAKTLKTSDRLGNFEIKEIISGEDESNLGGLVFEQEVT